jgi:hypothetical protein
MATGFIFAKQTRLIDRTKRIVLHSAIRGRMTQAQGKRPADEGVRKHTWSKCELEASKWEE